MTDQPLSPAAQAVIDAVVAASPRLQERGIRNTRSPLIAAALRAAVEQLTFNDEFAGAVINPLELLDIATELENTDA